MNKLYEQGNDELYEIDVEYWPSRMPDWIRPGIAILDGGPIADQLRRTNNQKKDIDDKFESEEDIPF